MTVVVPMANVEPEAGEQVTLVGPSTASTAVGNVKVTMAPYVLAASTPLMFSGVFEIAGQIESMTVTGNEAVQVLS